jgi:hypothetical protein
MKPIVALVICSLFLAACGAAPSVDTVATSVAATIAAGQPVQVATQPPVQEQPTKPPAPTATTAPTATIPPTVAPTEPPALSYSQPVILAELSGTGAAITEDYTLPQCMKGVLYWHVAPSYGAASLIIKQFNKDKGTDKTLVNSFAMDVGADGFGGSAYDPLLGGEYYWQTENTNEAWTIKLECQDNVAPVGEGMNIQGTGTIVTDFYTLHSCTKSVFNYSVEPSSGTASLILALCSRTECNTIVNEFKMDLSGSMTGQALQRVDDGDYFLISENTTKPWTVTWECKD